MRGGTFALRTSQIVFGEKEGTFISSGAGFMVMSNSGSSIRMTFGVPTDNPGKLKNIAMSNGISNCGVGASGGKDVCLAVDMVNMNVSTRMDVALPCKDGGTAMSVHPGFGSGHLALSNRVLPLSGSGVFGKESFWSLCDS